MKKVLLFAGVIGMLAFTSCSKKSDYTCTCEFQGIEIATVTIPDAKESDAEDACNALEAGGSACVLKEI